MNPLYFTTFTPSPQIFSSSVGLTVSVASGFLSRSKMAERDNAALTLFKLSPDMSS